MGHERISLTTISPPARLRAKSEYDAAVRPSVQFVRLVTTIILCEYLRGDFFADLGVAAEEGLAETDRRVATS